MGKFTDAVLAVIVLIIGIYFLTKLGMTAGSIWNMVKSFFSSPSSGSTNATSGLILGIASSSKIREKIRKKKELIYHAVRAMQLITSVRGKK